MISGETADKRVRQHAFHARAQLDAQESPPDVDDKEFVAEIEVTVDRSGRVSQPEWKRSSGNKRWDDSVRAVLATTTAISRPPPTNFPPRFLVRFDVQEEKEFFQP